MADKSRMKKWRLKEENRVYHGQATENWCFVENKSSIMYVIFKEIVSILKEYNLR
jgi:thiamine biosynthesis protein ThiC